MLLATEKIGILSIWLTTLTFFSFLAFDSLNYKILLFPGDLFLLLIVACLKSGVVFEKFLITIKTARVILRICVGLVIIILFSYTVSLFISNQHAACIDGQRTRDGFECYERELQSGRDYEAILFSLVFIYIAFVMGKSHDKELTSDV